MKKFCTWRDQIEEVEVIRETAKYVMLPPYGHRDAKRSDNRNYFDTWNEAHQFLIDREQANIAGLEKRITHHKETLSKLQEMSQP